MGSDLRNKLAAASHGRARRGSEIQEIYDYYKRFLSGKVVTTPLPERVHLRDENFLYWIHLQNQDPSRPGQWIASKAKIVIPLLEAGILEDSEFRYDPERAKALTDLPVLLRNPNCIHANLRHVQGRGIGGIRGNYIYVEYYGKSDRKKAFTLFDSRLRAVVLISSFWTNRKWVCGCAGVPAVYVRPASECTCGVGNR